MKSNRFKLATPDRTGKTGNPPDSEKNKIHPTQKKTKWWRHGVTASLPFQKQTFVLNLNAGV